MAQDTCVSTSSELFQSVNLATMAFSTTDRENFLEARSKARRALTCLREPVAAAGAAAYHRMEALAAFLDMDKQAVLRSFQAALSIQPSYQLPTTIAPERGPLHLWYTEAQEFPAPAFEELQPPERCSLLMDGAVEMERHEALPVIAQVLEWDGAVRWSGLLGPGELIPEEAYSEEYEPVWPPLPTSVPQPEPLPESPTKHVSPLWYGAGGAVLAAGGLYAAAWASRGTWQDDIDHCQRGDCWDDEEVYARSEALRKRTNALTFAAGGAGVVALGLGVGAVATFSWQWPRVEQAPCGTSPGSGRPAVDHLVALAW